MKKYATVKAYIYHKVTRKLYYRLRANHRITHKIVKQNRTREKM